MRGSSPSGGSNLGISGDDLLQARKARLKLFGGEVSAESTGPPTPSSWAGVATEAFVLCHILVSFLCSASPSASPLGEACWWHSVLDSSEKSPSLFAPEGCFLLRWCWKLAARDRLPLNFLSSCREDGVFLRCFSSVFSFQKFIMIHLGVNFFGLLTWGLLFLNLWLYVSWITKSWAFFLQVLCQPTCSFLPVFSLHDFTLIAVSGVPQALCLRFRPCSHCCLDRTVSFPVFELADPFLCPIHSAVEHALNPLFRPGGLRDFCGSVPDHHHEANIAIKWVIRFFGFPVHISCVYTILRSIKCHEIINKKQWYIH